MIKIRLISDYNRSRNDGESGVSSLQNQIKCFSLHIDGFSCYSDRTPKEYMETGLVLIFEKFRFEICRVLEKFWSKK